MKRLVRDCWPLLAVVALTAVLALQIPRKALLFEPVGVTVPKPFASFVTYDAATYGAVVQRARMSWQVRGSTVPTSESRIDAFDFVDDAPPLGALPLPDEFTARRAPGALDDGAVPLLPPSTADAAALVPVSVPPDDGADARRLRQALRADLLTLPESLQATE
ncbi:MAG: hypothetical protein ACI4RA_09110 [Kiritimatiellia bacterium]